MSRNEVPEPELPSGETSQRLMPKFHLAMYQRDAANTAPSWEEEEFFRPGSAAGTPGAAADKISESGAGAGSGGAEDGVAGGNGVEAGGGNADGAGDGAAGGAASRAEAGPAGFVLTPLAGAALRQARAGTQGAAPDAGSGVPATGPSSQQQQLALMAAANIRDEGAASEPAEVEVVPVSYCYPYVLMGGAWGRRKYCPAEWRYLFSSDGPPNRSGRGKGDEVLCIDSAAASEAAMDRACPNGDPVSRRKAQAFKNTQEKKAAKEAADKENAARLAEETENKRKRLVVLQEATAGMTNVASSLAKIAALKEEEQASIKRQKKIANIRLKLEMNLGDEAKNKQDLLTLLDEGS